MTNYCRSAKKIFSEAFSISWDILLRRYPPFVYGNDLPSPYIPVFLFHTEREEILEKQFNFLKNNGYKTLSIDEYFKIITGEIPVIQKSILITIDDGDKNLYDTFLPLLKKYNFKATVFIIAGLIEKLPQLITWRHASILHESGCFDIQSHTYSHRLIPISPKIIDFINPYLISKYQPYELTQYGEIKLGTPLFSSNSRMGKDKKYVIENQIIQQCVNFVEEKGKDEFFNNKRWRKDITEFYNNYKKTNKINEHFESKEEQKEEIYFELYQSKKLIEEKIPGLKVSHLSLPWNITGEITTQTAMRLGYKTIFLGKINRKYYGNNLPDPMNIPRVSSDFLCMLPGTGRDSLCKILIDKLYRKSKAGASYLTH